MCAVLVQTSAEARCQHHPPIISITPYSVARSKGHGTFLASGQGGSSVAPKSLRRYIVSIPQARKTAILVPRAKGAVSVNGWPVTEQSWRLASALRPWAYSSSSTSTPYSVVVPSYHPLPFCDELVGRHHVPYNYSVLVEQPRRHPLACFFGARTFGSHLARRP